MVITIIFLEGWLFLLCQGATPLSESLEENAKMLEEMRESSTFILHVKLD